MNRFDVLILALEYIEANLCDEINMEALARYSFSSLSSLQKQFRWTFNYSIKEYILKRRLASAGRELIETQIPIIDIALKYQYNSPEAFIRAFRRMYGIKPSEYRSQKKYVDVFPKIQICESGRDESPIYKDISALYDRLKDNQEVCAVCFDIVGLIGINNISRRAGDEVILETIRRINNVRSSEMPLFRLGGDEFALLIPGNDSEKCLQIERQVTCRNNEPIVYENREYPVVLRSWVGKVPDTSSLQKLSAELICNVKSAGK